MALNYNRSWVHLTILGQRCQVLASFGRWHSDNAGREHLEVATWIRKDTYSCLASYNPISNRMLSATFAERPRYMTIVQCYAPTVDKSDEEIEQSCKELGCTISEDPRRSLLPITGDFNARDDAIETDVLSEIWTRGKKR